MFAGVRRRFLHQEFAGRERQGGVFDLIAALQAGLHVGPDVVDAVISEAAVMGSAHPELLPESEEGR